MTDLDFPRRCVDGTCRVLEQRSLLVLAHQAEQRAGLRIVVGVFQVIPVVRGAFQTQRWLTVIGLFLPFAVAVRFVGQRAAMITIHAHGAVSVIAVDGAACGIHWNQVVIDTEPVALRIPVAARRA